MKISHYQKSVQQLNNLLNGDVKMSNSVQLSRTITENLISNPAAKRQQEIIEQATKQVINTLRRNHLDNKKIIRISYEKSYLKQDISVMLRKASKRAGNYPSNENSLIRPDGGFVYAVINNKKRLILSSEAKKQGTNELRASMDLPCQAQGNAIERAAKNYLEMTHILRFSPLFPYVMFFSGCDFRKGSSILDRLTSMNFQMPFNKLYIKKIRMKDFHGYRYESVPSIFVKVQQWGNKAVYDALLEAAKFSIKYYLKHS
jgi:type II restriction enzyme